VRQDGAADLLVVVVDGLLGVRQRALDALQLELRAVGDRAAGGLPGAELRGHLLPGVEVLVAGPVARGRVDRHAHAVALDRLRLHPQQPVLDQPVLVRRPQQRLAEPVAALLVVDVGDQPLDRDRHRLAVAVGDQAVLLDRLQPAVGGDVDRLPW
jgi:hypothetical protein